MKALDSRGITPEWVTADATVLLTFATIILGFFTALLWRATNLAVKDTAKGLKIAGDTAAAAQRQAEVTERVGMIQNVNALHGHLDYVASCALFGSRASNDALKKIPTSNRGFGRLLHRFEWQAAGDAQVESPENISTNGIMIEVKWEKLILSPHLDEFFNTAGGIVSMAEAARVGFLIDQRVIDALDQRNRVQVWREEISHLRR